MTGRSKQSGEGSGYDRLGPEFQLIARLRARLPGLDRLPDTIRRNLTLGIGDDAAVWQLADGTHASFTIDTMVEGVHAFTHEPAEDFGARALSSAASDICAMGDLPQLALVALQVPETTTDTWLERCYDGLARQAQRLGMAVAGGDIVDTPGPLALSVAVWGGGSGRPWRRGGARPGDLVGVTGTLGGSRAGLALVAQGGEPPGVWATSLIRRHLCPQARVEVVRALQPGADIHAGIDISDGLSSEAWHLALASGVTVRLREEALPLHPDLEAFLRWQRGRGAAPISAPRWALDSGEEYELLLTLPEHHRAWQERDPQGKRLLTPIGRIRSGPAAVQIEGAGKIYEPAPGGHSHRIHSPGVSSP